MQQQVDVRLALSGAGGVADLVSLVHRERPRMIDRLVEADGT